MVTFIPSISSCPAGMPCSMHKHSSANNPSADNLQTMTIKVSKSLEFPVVALPAKFAELKNPDRPERE